jgi:hypothetical protein
MNVELMLQVADVIEAHPEIYNQREWCGTTCCIAGHALALSYAVQPREVLVRAMHKMHIRVALAYCKHSARVWAMHLIPALAQDALDIDEPMADILFGCGLHWPPPFRLHGPSDPVGDSIKAAAYLRWLVQREQLPRIIDVKLTIGEVQPIPQDRVEVEEQEAVLV